jgi:serine/threonine protein phosphatase 1
MGRTFAIGDIHGDLAALDTLLARLPRMVEGDTIVFVGDYVDRGPSSADVVARVRNLAAWTQAKVVALRGNHEDAWVQVVDTGWPEFVMPRRNGCLEALRSFKGGPVPDADELGEPDEIKEMFSGEFLPADVVAWMRDLPYFYEDDHAIYVHAGLVRGKDGDFHHPSEMEPKRALLWTRDRDFFANYVGTLVVFGHTSTDDLPAELSGFTPEDPEDLWAGPSAIGLDTGAGKGGFLSAVELPARRVYESR